jgi:hypothetical protein
VHEYPPANEGGDQAQQESDLPYHVTGLTHENHKTEKVEGKLTKGISLVLTVNQRFPLFRRGFPPRSPRSFPTICSDKYENAQRPCMPVPRPAIGTSDIVALKGAAISSGVRISSPRSAASRSAY